MTLLVQTTSCHFDLNQQIVLLWCFSWSGLGTASQRRVPECTEWPGYLINWIFFFPDGSGIFQDDNAKIQRALVVKEWSMRTHECQGAWGVIFTHELATTESWLYPIKSRDCWRRLKEWFNSPVINAKSRPKINSTLDGNTFCDIA